MTREVKTGGTALSIPTHHSIIHGIQSFPPFVTTDHSVTSVGRDVSLTLSNEAPDLASRGLSPLHPRDRDHRGRGYDEGKGTGPSRDTGNRMSLTRCGASRVANVTGH